MGVGVFHSPQTTGGGGGGGVFHSAKINRALAVFTYVGSLRRSRRYYWQMPLMVVCYLNAHGPI